MFRRGCFENQNLNPVWSDVSCHIPALAFFRATITDKNDHTAFTAILYKRSYCTYGLGESNFSQNQYFHFLTILLRRKFHTDSKIVSKSSMQYQKGLNFSIELSGKWPHKFLKLYEESWPKLKQVSKKVPTPRTLELLAFDEKSNFDCLVLFLKGI